MIEAAIYCLVIACGVYVVLAVALTLVIATGLAPEGSTLRKWWRRATNWLPYASGGLVVGGLFLRQPRETRRKGPLRAQVRAHAEARRNAREMRADAAAAIREIDAAAVGTVAAIRFTAENRVEAIRAEVAAMDDDALLDAAREVGR